MATTRSRPDFEAHQVATRAPFAEVARELRELLGARLTAYVGGVSETRAVRQWADGARAPGELVQRRCGSLCRRRWRSKRSMGAG